MRRYSANYIFPAAQPPIKNGIVEVDDNGAILRVVNPGNNFKEIHSTEFHNGIIVPGFVNAHCHLELSHLLGKLPEKLGIVGFIKAVADFRNIDFPNVVRAIEHSILELENTGTVAVGDICNTTDTLQVKAKSKIHFHNFIEVFGINPASANAILENSQVQSILFKKYFQNSTSITPHATYSLSEKLWGILKNYIDENDALLSIHFAEGLPEYEFLKNGTGPLLGRYKQLNIPFEAASGQTPSSIAMNHINTNRDLLLIHNTFAGIEELKWLNGHFRKVTFVTCPESNLYIEGKLPDLQSMLENGLRMAIGTDSLASATTLNMLYHINLILNNFPAIPFGEILRWATLNGADALKVSHKYGSIEVGKQPGLNLITNFDFANMRPQPNSAVKRLV